MSAETPKRKNILYIIADQWRPDRLGLPAEMVPNVTALMRDGVSFSRHYGQVIPCAPSRASLYTGLYAMTHRVLVNGSPLAAQHRTIAERLREHGYRPTLFGYTDTALDPTGRTPADPALSDSEGVLPGMEVGTLLIGRPEPWIADLRRKGYRIESAADLFTPDRSQPNANGGVAGYPAKWAAEDSDTAFLTDQLLGWMDLQEPGWCAMACYIRPHPPFVAAAPYHGIVDPASLPPPLRAPNWEDEASQHPFLDYQLRDAPAAMAFDGLEGRIRDIAERDWRSIRAAYCGLMVEVDHHIGRLIAALKASGQYDDTLIVFTSDHGEPMFDHWMNNQASHHDCNAHLPLVIRDPDPSARAQDGSVIEAFTESVDLVPSFLDWLGAALPPELDGQSLLPFLRGKTPDNWRNSVHWEYHFRSSRDFPFGATFGLTEDECMLSVVRDAEFKHVFFPGLPPILIDLRKDPGEMRNVAEDPAYRGIERDYLAEQLRLRILHADRRLSTMVLDRGGPRRLATPRRIYRSIRDET